MDVLDYIRIRGVAEIDDIRTDEVTYNIEFSEDERFKTPRRGVIVIRFGEYMTEDELSKLTTAEIADTLVGKVFIRVKKEERGIQLHHLHGMPLRDWLAKKVR